MKRRQFLKSAGCFVASASLVPWLSCSDDNGNSQSTPPAHNNQVFPQGVASGDPQPNSVMLWTRAVPKTNADSVQVRLRVSESEDLSTLVVEKMLEARKDNDFTLRVYVDNLTPNRVYYYQFDIAGDKSRVGRTRTAPTPDADFEPRFAWASCQDYSANYYTAYRLMIDNDKAAPADEQLHFVLFVGDFVYETSGANFMQAIDDDLQPVALKTADGAPRLVPAFPSGGRTRPDGASYAYTVDDYRHLYKTYLSDPDLQEARARWPFVQVWDDHEFTDDCWQSQANYTNEATTDEPSQARRLAASQAWFEYTPAVLSDAQPTSSDAPAQPAKDFEFVQVEDAPYDAVIEVDEPNNVKAISAITIYRSFRWGKHMELVLTDCRSYRSDQPIAEEDTEDNILIFDPRVALPKDAVNTMDAGREANGGKPPSRVQDIPNSRADSAPGTMLGAKQKAWWKEVMSGSTATFKVWGNSVPILRFLLDRSDVPVLPHDLLLSDDAWDGYNTERKELMAYLKDNEILNVVSLSGDHHAHYAGLVQDDFDAPNPTPVMVDVTVAGIASNSQWSAVASALSSAFEGNPLAALIEPVRKLIVFDSTPLGGDSKAVVNLNTLIRYGSKAANVAAATYDVAASEAARDPKVNPHLRYADAHAFGYGLAHVTADEMRATLVSIERTYEDLGENNPKPKARGTAAFTIPRVEQLSELSLEDPELSGTKPFPLEAS